ncbi:chemotaxis protein CheB [Sulfurimonas sp. SAG-AH-194-I05]|nr:CheB methylesterase domain-containing protein [Sulfurimonas sp. SAG-AH-194-I05]MDF1874893.1 chemotaxis protein CheB [Sulfurimonas sp. SAG-AH-194-I05]
MKHLEPKRLILIGASTGGPMDIKKILQSIPKDFKACIIIAQHMGDQFLASFASHMGGETHLHVQLAKHNETLECDTVYVVSKCTHVEKARNTLAFKVRENTKKSFNPNINALFTSCANFSNDIDVLACILTGIGDDGSSGMLCLSKTKARCISANKESSAVYGMPMRAQEVSSRVQSLSLDEIIATINTFGE